MIVSFRPNLSCKILHAIAWWSAVSKRPCIACFGSPSNKDNSYVNLDTTGNYMPWTVTENWSQKLGRCKTSPANLGKFDFGWFYANRTGRYISAIVGIWVWNRDSKFIKFLHCWHSGFHHRIAEISCSINVIQKYHIIFDCMFIPTCPPFVNFAHGWYQISDSDSSSVS